MLQQKEAVVIEKDAVIAELKASSLAHKAREPISCIPTPEPIPLPQMDANQSKNGHNVPFPRLSEYNGSTVPFMSFRGFISQMKNLATNCKWKMDKKILHLLQSLKGGAATIAFEKVMEPVRKDLVVCEKPNVAH